MKHTNSRFLKTITACACLAAGSANAALIASFIDGTTTTGANLTPTTGITVSNLTATGITFNTVTGITRSGETAVTPAGPTAGSSAGSLWLNAPNSQVANTTTPSFNDDYYSFTVTADSGNLPILTTLTFDIGVAVAASSGAMQTYFQVFAAADGGSFSAVGSTGTTLVDPVPGGNYTLATTPITANIDLTGLAEAQSYEFRIALGDNSGAGTKTQWLQGIQLNAIPEPTTALLGALGLLALLRRRR